MPSAMTRSMNVSGGIDFRLAAQCSPNGCASSIIVRVPCRAWRAIRLAMRARSSICSGMNWKLSLTLSPEAMFQMETLRW